MLAFIRIIGFSLVSSFLIFMGKNDMIIAALIKNDVLSEKINIQNIQFWLFLTGIMWSGFWLPIETIMIKKRYRKKSALFYDLLEYDKQNHFQLIKEKIKEFNTPFNTRIFKPINGLIGLWNKYVLNRTILCLTTVKGISDSYHHNSLQFTVSAKTVEGMVGKSYHEKALCVDLDLTDNNYFLSEAQISKIGNIQFCSTIPIFNKNQNKIQAIVAVDSTTKLDFNEEEKVHWRDHMVYYAAFIDKHTNL